MKLSDKRGFFSYAGPKFSGNTPTLTRFIKLLSRIGVLPRINFREQRTIAGIFLFPLWFFFYFSPLVPNVPGGESPAASLRYEPQGRAGY